VTTEFPPELKLTREQLISIRRPVTITKHPLPHIYEMRKATFVPTYKPQIYADKRGFASIPRKSAATNKKRGDSIESPRPLDNRLIIN